MCVSPVHLGTQLLRLVAHRVNHVQLVHMVPAVMIALQDNIVAPMMMRDRAKLATKENIRETKDKDCAFLASPASTKIKLEKVSASTAKGVNSPSFPSFYPVSLPMQSLSTLHAWPLSAE